MKYPISLVLLLIVLNFSCLNSSKKSADQIFINAGAVYTLDDEFSKAESFVVEEGKVVAVGNSKELLQTYKSNEIIDLKGKYVYPGFNDAHCHFNGYGLNLMQYADLRGTRSQEEIYEILKAHHSKFGGKWVLGRSWDQNDWQVKDFPTKEGLDKIFPDVPVYLVRIDGHAAWCNSKALKIAGVTAESEVEGGDVILKNGEPSGILIDRAEGLVAKYIPDISPEQQELGLLAAQKNCFAVGLTSVTDCGVGKNTVLLMDEMQKAGELKMRINAMLSPTKENFEHFIEKGIYKTPRLMVNTLKLYADGALGSRGALMLEDYDDDPGNKGLQMSEKEYYERMCQKAYENDYIVATHCIGDGANRLMLDVYGKFLKGKNDRRWRIEHSQIIHPDDFEKFGRYSIIPSIQATHCTSDMPWAEDRIGPERIKGAYSYQTLLKQNNWLANGTDFPVESIEPLFTFYSSVFRTDHLGWPEGGWRIEEGLSREQTLRSMTIWAAKASFEEKVKGSLEPGKYADFVILDTDLMTALPKEILYAKIVSTWVEGEKVFENQSIKD